MTIDLYTWSTPNGRKVSIMLEELGASYQVHPIDITKDEQFAPAFLAINPNNKIPAIVDAQGPAGKPIVVFESGAILLYLARRFASPLLPEDERRQAEVLQWLMFQMGGIGPMFGQLHHFRRYAPHETYGLGRYEKEVHRLYGVMDRLLADRPYLGGDDYSIADIATYPWIARFPLHGLEWAQVPNVQRWYDALSGRPAVIRGMAIPAA
ncbi:MAG: glutathione S-transferase N-terminal domain-containing protein [Sphingopyxis sp.]|nr:glutathione S-transferase N-terminal domain-containing protein [Sphingopyxis sp.]